VPTAKRLLKQESKATVFLVLASFAGTVAALTVIVLAYYLSDVVSRVFIGNESLRDVAPYFLVMLSLLLVRGASIWGREIFGQRSASLLKSDLRRRLSKHLFLLGPIYTRAERSGELVNTIVEGAESLDQYISQYLPTMALATIAPVMVFIAILILDPWSTLVLLVAGPMMLLILALIGGQAKTITERRFLEMSWMSAFFLDILQGLPTLKMFGRERDQAENIREISDHYGSTTMEILHTAFQSSLVMEWATTAATALVALEVSLRLMSGNLSFTVALTVLLLTPEFFLPIRQYALRFHSGTAGKAAADRIYAILDTQPIEKFRNRKVSQARRPERLSIRFEEVGYAYDDGARPALRSFSMELSQGQTLALVGPTGAGKTTVSQLLLRFAVPDIGKITVGGIPLESIDRDSWRGMVAWVPQIPHLFHGSIADNIRLARPDASHDEIVKASMAAHAHAFIDGLPRGYDTQVGERGARLSGGQQQRVAIARAFLKDAPLLILDEPTSHLDRQSEEYIRASLAQLVQSRTVLIIAHRLNLAAGADQIVVMEKGHVVETGTHKDLLASQGAYSRLAASFGGFTENGLSGSGAPS
jgi:ATP-binding cassette subfamily C protein CydD